MILALGLAASSVWARPHKHERGDLLLGLNWGIVGAMMNSNPMDAVNTVKDNLNKLNGSYNWDPTTMTGSISISGIKLPDFFASVNMEIGRAHV
jgi:hypothetical protein